MADRQQASASGGTPSQFEALEREKELWLSSTKGSPYNLQHDASLDAYCRVRREVNPTKKVSPELHLTNLGEQVLVHANGKDLGSIAAARQSDGTITQGLTTPAKRRI